MAGIVAPGFYAGAGGRPGQGRAAGVRPGYEVALQQHRVHTARHDSREGIGAPGPPEFIRTSIFEPLGMTHSLYGSFSAIIPDRAAGYTKGEKGGLGKRAVSEHVAALRGRVADVERRRSGEVGCRRVCGKAPVGYLMGEGVYGVSPDHWRGDWYGFGWQLGTYDGHDIVRHGGGIPGYSTKVLRMPADHVYVVVLTNSDAPPRSPEDSAVRIGAELMGDPVHDPSAIAVPVEVLDTYAGRYQIALDDVRTITREGTHMLSQRNGGEKAELISIGAGEFSFRESFQRLSFEQDSSGRIVRVVSRTLGGMPEVGERIR